MPKIVNITIQKNQSNFELEDLKAFFELGYQVVSQSFRQLKRIGGDCQEHLYTTFFTFVLEKSESIPNKKPPIH